MKKKALLLAAALLGLASLAGAVSIGKKAPNIKAKDLFTGKTLELSKMRGKVVIVDFWATWCPPCRMEIPHFMELQKQFRKKGLVVWGMSVDQGGAQAVRRFFGDTKVDYSMSHDDDDQYSMKYGGIQAIPTTFMIGKHGEILHEYVGYHPQEVFEKDIRDALRKS